MANRYKLLGFDSTIEPSGDGEYVKYGDYAALEAQLVEREAANERLTADRDFWKEQFQVETRARIEAEAQLAEARQVVALFENYGCPVCHGDCASANPPVPFCPMQIARRELEGGENG